MTDMRDTAELNAKMEATAAAAVEALEPYGTAVALVHSLAVRAAFTGSFNQKPPDHWKYATPTDLVLAEGVAFSAEDVRYVEGLEGTPKNCYQDALDLAVEHADEGWSYAEGYAIGSAGIDVQHAWVVDDEGKVVDPTWQAVAAEHDDGVFPHSQSAYVGIVLNPEVAWRYVVAKGSYSVLDWMRIEPLLEHGLDALPDPDWLD